MAHYIRVKEGVLNFMLDWRGQYCPRMTIFFYYGPVVTSQPVCIGNYGLGIY